jgi:hypothetical protein
VINRKIKAWKPSGTIYSPGVVVRERDIEEWVFETEECVFEGELEGVVLVLKTELGEDVELERVDELIEEEIGE